MPVHWAKFKLALHPWREPIERVSKQALIRNVKLTTPKIGEPILLDHIQNTTRWWETITQSE